MAGPEAQVGGVAGAALPAGFVQSPDTPEVRAAEVSAGEAVASGVTTFESVAADRGLEDDTSTVDLASLTRAELYELAQDRDVEGRSDMTKDELIAALKE